MTTNEYIIFILAISILLVLMISLIRDFMIDISQNKDLIKNINNLDKKNDNKKNDK